MTNETTTFDEWLARLEVYCRERYGEPYGSRGPLICGVECWRERYDEGDTPEEALHGDAENWEDDA